MNCDESRRLIYLDGPAERSERETQALREHLAGCPSCPAEAALAASLKGAEYQLREATMAMPNLSDVRARVLTRTASPSRPPKPWVADPRFAYAVALVAAVAWFGAGQWQIRSAHALLNERPNEHATMTTGPQIVYTVHASAAQDLVEQNSSLPDDVRRLDGTIVVSQSTAQDLLNLSESRLLYTVARRSAQREQLSAALRILRSAVDVSIRFRSKGA